MDNNFNSTLIETVARNMCDSLISQKIIEFKDCEYIAEFIKFAFELDKYYDSRHSQQNYPVFSKYEELSKYQEFKTAFEAFEKSHKDEFSITISNSKEYLEATSENIGTRVLVAIIAVRGMINRDSYFNTSIHSIIDHLLYLGRISNDLLDVANEKDSIRKDREVNQKKLYDFLSEDKIKSLRDEYISTINHKLESLNCDDNEQLSKLKIICSEMLELTLKVYVHDMESFWI